MNPLIESRTKRTLIRCPICSKPIGERLGDNWWFEKINRGAKGKIPFTMTEVRKYTVHCWDENCKGGHIFVKINEKLTINDRTDDKLSPLV